MLLLLLITVFCLIKMYIVFIVLFIQLIVLNSQYNEPNLTNGTVPANQFLISGRKLIIDGPLEEQVIVKVCIFLGIYLS